MTIWFGDMIWRMNVESGEGIQVKEFNRPGLIETLKTENAALPWKGSFSKFSIFSK